MWRGSAVALPAVGATAGPALVRCADAYEAFGWPCVDGAANTYRLHQHQELKGSPRENDRK